jgi:hypothetical protein
MNKNFKQMVSNRQKKKRLVTRALVMTLFMALFTQFAQAQTPKIFMRDGSTTIARSNPLYEFYDSHGPSQTPECWNYWYAFNEDFTYVFKPEIAGDMIKVSFVLQPCYNNDVSIGNWALRLNNDFLYVYEGNGVNEDNLIAAYTGNSQQPFTIMTNGAVTFHFVSDGRYREEGWKANVQLIQANQGTMQAQAPFIRRSTCFDAAELLPTTLDAAMYYTTDNTDPRTSSTALPYKDPIDFPASGSLKVKAASKLEANSNAWSDVVEYTFTDDDRIPTPGVPTITRDANSNIVVMTPAAVPTGVNETYVVRYTVTTNGTEPVEPDINNSILYQNPITCTTPNSWYKAKTFGLSCSNWVSTETAELHITTLYAPAPVISFGDDMFITASEGGVLYDILYTLDGSDPTLSPMNGTHSSTTVSLAGIPYGTTVKALAFKMNGDAIDTQYQPSVVVSAIYVQTNPDGSTQNVVNNTLVLIDDREDHSWSYYSDSETNPIHSLNPVDIKITYSGNGTNNMTPNPSSIGNALNTVSALENLSNYTENATNVHVNHDALANQFIYLKTLENDQTDGTGDYTYTTIPNPFQARPIHHNAKGEALDGDNNVISNESLDGTIEIRMASIYGDCTNINYGKRSISDLAPHTNNNPRAVSYEYEKVTSSQSDWSGTYLLGFPHPSNTTGREIVFDGTVTAASVYGYSVGGLVGVSLDGNIISDLTTNDDGSAALLTFAPITSSGNTYYTIQINGADYLGSESTGLLINSSANTTSYYWNISYDNANSAVILYSQGSGSNTYRIRGFRETEYDGDYYYGFSNNESLSYGSGYTASSFTYYGVSLFKQSAPKYCSPAPTSIDGTGIHPVVFGSGSETVNNTSYPNSSPYYGDYTSMIGAYQSGASATVTITYNTGYTYGTLIWVDWDQDYDFEDNEVVAYGSVTNTNPITRDYTFIIPSNQASGYYRMRIGAADSYFDTYISNNGSSGDHDPCSTGTYKVFHDYTLHVISAVEPPAQPVITVASGTYPEAFSTTITCSTSGAVIYYTTDGSNPSANNGTPISSGDAVSITQTCTLKAVAVKDGAVSTVASASYLISTSGGSLDCEDFESYSSSANSSYSTAGSLPTGWDWRYYSNYHYNTNYVPHLYNGTLAKDGVGIVMTAGYDEYASTGGSSSSYIGYSYFLLSDITLVESATVTFNTWVENTAYGTMNYGYMNSDNLFTSLGVATTASYSGATSADGVTTFTVPAAAANQKLVFRWTYSTSTSGANYSAVIDNVCQESTGAPSAPVFSLASGEYTGAQTVTITCSTAGATIHYTIDGTTPTASSPTVANGGTVTISSSCTLQAIATNEYGNSAVTSATYVISAGTSNSLDYRGFYAWKVTHLSNGLTINVNGTDYTSSNLGNGVVVYPEEDVVFKTENAEGNEVEFVALWAQAYYTTSTSGMSNYASNSGRYKNAYERNFHKVSSSIPVLSTYPYTVSTINPDGTGTVGTITRTSNLSCSNDMKLENMNLSMSSYYIDGNGKNLAIGRGVKNGTSNVATAVYGDYAPATSTSNFTLRVESGQYTTLYDFYNSSSNSSVTITTGFNSHVILGSDYDRASGTNANDNLIVAGPTEVGYYTFTSSSSAKVHFKVLSGTFGTDAADQEFYMGFEYGTGNKLAHRTLEIFGGEFLGGLAGGIEEGMSASEEMLKMRIHGGTFHRYFYGAGQYSAATGTRRFVVTGGTFDCWIAGGCYGTSEGGGATDGDINLYFGGKAEQTSTGGLFGAGYGNYGTGNGYYTVNKSTVVVADDAQVAGNVYGGGNNGYATDVTKVYVLGGDALNIAGNVYGGANKAQSDAAVTVTMTEGTVDGSLYGGANTSGEVKGLATVNVSGGTVTNVYGGGLGSGTNMAAGTKVNISGGTINNNVYGGGALGTTDAGTEVTMSDGSVNDVFGAGMGEGTNYANVNGNTKVTVKGGTVNGAVYGGGEEGSVKGGVGGTITTSNTICEDFSGYTATAYDNDTPNPTGWSCSRSTTTSSRARKPHVSNSTITQNDGNFLIMSVNANNSTVRGVLAVMPKYDDITSVTFKYCKSSNNNNTLTVGYVTNNSGTYSTANPTFQAFTDVTLQSTAWTTITLTQAQIDAINSNNGYIAFRLVTTASTNSTWRHAAIDDVCVTASVSETLPPNSTVTISGGEVKGDVFGGGKMGKTYGSTFVNVIGDLDKTIIRQNVFAGAYGVHDTVFVGGPKTVNIMGGRVYGSVYGGSRNADDANEITDTHTGNETEPTSVTNITGGQVDEHVYAAGYYGKTYGSVYGFIGLDAVQNAPHHADSLGKATASDLGITNVEFTKRKLVINGTVWAGGDWGVFNGSFGAPTISGNSNIYIDGLGYSTDGNDPNATNYMNIAGSILGSGTSCDAGSLERTLIIRDYGADIANTGSDADVNPYARASRQSTSIQRFHNVLFDRAHIGFTGQGKVNSLNNTEKYSLYEIDTVVRVANGSTLVMNAPASQLQSVRSVTCGDSYTISLKDNSNAFATVNYNGLGETGGATDNKIRVNGGSYVEVRHFADPDNPGANEKSYGELAGFFHMMSSNDSDDATCAYARPKDSEEPGNSVPASEDFSDDGGFVSYTSRYNQYDANGALTAEGGQVQLRYENHTPNQRDNSEYFRIWRYGGNHHHLEGIFNAEAVDDDTDYKTVTVTIQLPAWHSKNSYYRFDRTGTTTYNTLIDYGSDVLTYNAAAYGAVNGNNWMYYDSDNEAQVTGLAVDNSTIAANLASGINDNENLNYGLVIIPGDAMTGSTYIINSDADNYLATNAQFNCATGGMTQVPTVTFTLTYSNHLTANMSWDPMVIPLVQCDENGQITDYVDIELTINTSTDITSGFTTQVYARMIGGTNIAEVSTVHLVLPTFPVAVNGEEAEFSLIKAVFTPDVELNSEGQVVANSHNVVYSPKSGVSFGYNNFGLTIGAVANPDNTDDWRDVQGEKSGNPGDGSDLSLYMGKAGGRSSLTFGINLYYNSNYTVNDKTHMGDVTFTVQITNYQGGTGDDHIKTFDVTVEIYRIGSGKNFYVDGINGEDASGENRGRYPDKAAKTINYIFNRLGYMPGDNIFVVNEMPINKNTTWDGASFQNEVNVYRYPGGHGLSGENPSFDNSPYLGTLADVTRELNVKGIMMDGMYAESQASPHNSTLYPSACSFDGEAEAPMIVIEDGGRVNLTSITKLQNNYNANNSLRGGAVNVNYGGILAMNMSSSITGNINAQGGGVFVDGAMIVSDSIVVYNNYKETGMTHQNNVYLAPMTSGRDNRDGSFRVVQIGTSAADAYAELLQPTGSDYNTKIGVSKEDWSNTYEGYMPVVYAEGGTESYLNAPYNTQNLIVHDENVYNLERYVTDLHADSRLYLYWLGTWVTAQYWNPYFESNEAAGYTPYMTAAQLSNIETAEQLAWVISLANGENGVDKTNANYVISPIKVTKDIDMSANIWVPIGNETSLFTGTFEGNGHVVKGIKSPLSRTNMGMFGATQNATISDVIVNAQFNGSANNMGTVVGTMTGGTISNVEGVGSLTNSYADGNTGGLVGVNAQVASGSTAGVIHSSFATPDISGGKNIGGLLAVNYGNLLNAYSNVTIDGGTNVGGLVAINHGLVENCYNITEVTYPFAAVNDGTIKLCYAADGITTYVGDNTGGTLSNHGNYAATDPTHTYGYMYWDNAVSVASGQTNPCVVDTIKYANNQIARWPGLLSTLEHWVDSINAKGGITYTKWLRPTTKYINDDLPVLCFPKDNCLVTSTGRALKYSAFDGSSHSTFMSREVRDGSDGFGNQGFGQTPQATGDDPSSSTSDAGNGIDNLLEEYEDKTGYIFVYDNAIDVERVPDEHVYVFINEDVAFKQAEGAGEFINTQVGVSFDNSCGTATDFFGNTLAYDWHMLSTPLANAPLGISYNSSAQNWWDESDNTQMSGVEHSYMPDGGANDNTWDLYCFYEPEYHWINLKRNSDSHHHYDANPATGNHDLIEYTNEDNLVAGKGYMAAIKTDTYLCNDGTLNGPSNPVSIKLTKKSHDPGTEELGYNLLGNPYQAYLDVNLFLGNNGLSSYWVYVAEDDNYIAGNADASTNPALPSATLHPHQGFFVLASSDNQEVNFDYSTMALTTPVANSYYRGEKLDYPLVNLFATSEKGKKDLAVIEFNRPEFGGSKKMRAINNADFELAAHMNNTRYSILFTEEGTEKVPVHFRTNEAGTFTMTWSTYHGNFTSLFLVDNLTGTRTDMLRSDHYTFNGTPDDYDARFYITFKCTGVEEYIETEEDFAWYNGNEWVINGNGTLQVIDMLGRVLMTRRVETSYHGVSTTNLATGVYMLRLINENKTKVQKIIVK